MYLHRIILDFDIVLSDVVLVAFVSAQDTVEAEFGLIQWIGGDPILPGSKEVVVAEALELSRRDD